MIIRGRITNGGMTFGRDGRELLVRIEVEESVGLDKFTAAPSHLRGLAASVVIGDDGSPRLNCLLPTPTAYAGPTDDSVDLPRPALFGDFVQPTDNFSPPDAASPADGDDAQPVDEGDDALTVVESDA